MRCTYQLLPNHALSLALSQSLSSPFPCHGQILVLVQYHSMNSNSTNIVGANPFSALFALCTHKGGMHASRTFFTWLAGSLRGLPLSPLPLFQHSTACARGWSASRTVRGTGNHAAAEQREQHTTGGGRTCGLGPFVLQHVTFPRGSRLCLCAPVAF